MYIIYTIYIHFSNSSNCTPNKFSVL